MFYPSNCGPMTTTRAKGMNEASPQFVTELIRK